MARWVFVRHAESEANAEGWLAGHTDVGLTPRGVEQATALASVLSDEPIERVFSSDLTRAHRTAELATAGLGLPIRTTASLRERSLGTWEGIERRRLKEAPVRRALISWDEGPPGGESQLAVARRGLAFFAEVEAPDACTLVVAHATFLRSVLGVLDGMDRSAIGRVRIDNAAVLVRDVAPGDWSRLATRLGAV